MTQVLNQAEPSAPASLQFPQSVDHAAGTVEPATGQVTAQPQVEQQPQQEQQPTMRLAPKPVVAAKPARRRFRLRSKAARMVASGERPEVIDDGYLTKLMLFCQYRPTADKRQMHDELDDARDLNGRNATSRWLVSGNAVSFGGSQGGKAYLRFAGHPDDDFELAPDQAQALGKMLSRLWGKPAAVHKALGHSVGHRVLLPDIKVWDDEAKTFPYKLAACKLLRVLQPHHLEPFGAKPMPKTAAKTKPQAKATAKPAAKSKANGKLLDDDKPGVSDTKHVLEQLRQLEADLIAKHEQIAAAEKRRDDAVADAKQANADLVRLHGELGKLQNRLRIK